MRPPEIGERSIQVPTSARPVAIVPLRSPGEGKTRLAPGLDRGARSALTAAMLTDVVAALRQARLDVVVVAAGPAAQALASSLDTQVLTDDPGTASLDRAIEGAQRRLALAGGSLVVHADLPMLTAGDVAAMLATDRPVAIGVAHDGGTSALLRRPATVIGTAFGPSSARAHAHLARTAGVRAHLVRRPGLTHDVDEVTDIRALDPDAVGAATAHVLAWLDLPART